MSIETERVDFRRAQNNVMRCRASRGLDPDQKPPKIQFHFQTVQGVATCYTARPCTTVEHNIRVNMVRSQRHHGIETHWSEVKCLRRYEVRPLSLLRHEFPSPGPPRLKAREPILLVQQPCSRAHRSVVCEKDSMKVVEPPEAQVFERRYFKC